MLENTLKSGAVNSRGKEGKKEKERFLTKDQDLIEEVIAGFAALGRRKQGLASTRRGMRRLASWCEENETTLISFSRDDARDYRRDLMARGLAASSVLSYLYAGSSLCQELVKRGQRLDNPFRGLSVKKTSALPRSMLKEGEWARVLDRLSRYYDEPSFRRRQDVFRAHVVAELLYASGLRIAEAACLSENDIDFTSRTLKVREGKGGRERTAFLSDYAVRVLSLFLSVRPQVIHEGFGHRERLFGMSEANLSHFMSLRLAEACRKEGLPLVTSHALRHMAGWHLLRAGASLRSIQGILGHRCLKSTELYTKVDKESLTAVLDEYHPRSGKT